MVRVIPSRTSPRQLLLTHIIRADNDMYDHMNNSIYNFL
jgi:acyl-ACP thioesterase